MKARLTERARANNTNQSVKSILPQCCSSALCLPTADETCYYCRHCFAVLGRPLTAKPYPHAVRGQS